MRVWFKNQGDTVPTFFSGDDIDRPDESYFDSDVPVDWYVQFYTIEWHGDVPSLIRNMDADELVRQKELEASKATKKAELDQVFQQVAVAPVTTPHGTFFGGKESARDLFFERELAQELSQTTVDFIDTDHVTHTLPIADATQVIHAVALDYRGKLFKKHNKKKITKEATNSKDVESITWDSVE